MPGRVIQAMKTAKSKCPVYMLDEVDKVGLDFRGDPTSALLEVLDPEQNGEFSDHYLEIPYDLSKVVFIATANQLDPIPTPLRDRMEVIEIGGYTEDEKVGIARGFLIPKQCEFHGLQPEQLTITDDAVVKLVREYTREAGVRNLERELASLCRKVARKVATEMDNEEELMGVLPPHTHHTHPVQPATAEPHRMTAHASTVAVEHPLLFASAPAPHYSEVSFETTEKK
jgi:ATP-dependent Lon protease